MTDNLTTRANASDTQVWVILHLDRHTDPGIYLHTTEQAARLAAHTIAIRAADHYKTAVEVRDIDGCNLYLGYGEEGDHVAVMERRLNTP